MALVEIVHFHKLLRGEMESLCHNCEELKNIMTRDQILNDSDFEFLKSTKNQFELFLSVFKAHSVAEDQTIWPALKAEHSLKCKLDQVQDVIEDHTDEEARFLEINKLLIALENCVHDFEKRATVASQLSDVMRMAYSSANLHLKREETIIHPLIQESLSKETIEIMVGKIMGYRSSEMMEIILKMMVRNLCKEDKDFMVDAMKKAVKDTYFEKWLGYLSSSASSRPDAHNPSEDSSSEKVSPGCDGTSDAISDGDSEDSQIDAVAVADDLRDDDVARTRETLLAAMQLIARCEGLTSLEKTKVMAALHTQPRSADDRERRSKRKRKTDKQASDDLAISSDGSGKLLKASEEDVPAVDPAAVTEVTAVTAASSMCMPCVTTDSSTEPAGGSDASADPRVPPEDVLATYRPGRIDELGCKHYKRACKLVSSCCGRAFTCRLCHDEHFQNDDTHAHTLDRFAVTHVVCMSCNTVQRTAQHCRVDSCGKLFSRHYCPICSLFDDDPTHDIYHCPYCNLCRKGKGLGIDFRHCMTCNACVSVKESHKCLPRSMQGMCPICMSYLFDSTDPLKAPPCGHVMHLLCFMNYRKMTNNNFRNCCPTCRQVIDSDQG